MEYIRKCQTTNLLRIMRPRNNIVAIFSTFVQFEAGEFSHWSSDPKLRRSMEKCLMGQSVKERSQ